MSQSLKIVGPPPAVGNAGKWKVCTARLTNTSTETTYTLTAATLGVTEFVAIPVDEGAAAAIRSNPTAGQSGLYTSVALTFTQGDELTFLILAV